MTNSHNDIERLYKDDPTFWQQIDAMFLHVQDRNRNIVNLGRIIADLRAYSTLPLVEIVTEKFGYPLDLFDIEYLEAKR